MRTVKICLTRSLPPLYLSGPASHVAERWRKWKRAFEYYAAAKGIDNVPKKTSQLLHFAGISSKINKILVRSQQLAMMRIMSPFANWILVFEWKRIFPMNALLFGR